METENRDFEKVKVTEKIEWWKEVGVDKRPDFGHARFSGYQCECGSYLRLVVSKFLRDFAQDGVKRSANYVFCPKCKDKLDNTLPFAVDLENLGKTILWFGKHKGKALDQVPMDYLEWAKNNLSDPRTKKKIAVYLDLYNGESPSPRPD